MYWIKKQKPLIKYIDDTLTHKLILDNWDKQYGLDKIYNQLHPDRQVGISLPYGDKTIRVIIDYHYNTTQYTLNYYTMIKEDGEVVKYLKR